MLKALRSLYLDRSQDGYKTHIHTSKPIIIYLQDGYKTHIHTSKPIIMYLQDGYKTSFTLQNPSSYITKMDTKPHSHFKAHHHISPRRILNPIHTSKPIIIYPQDGYKTPFTLQSPSSYITKTDTKPHSHFKAHHHISQVSYHIIYVSTNYNSNNI